MPQTLPLIPELLPTSGPLGLCPSSHLNLFWVAHTLLDCMGSVRGDSELAGRQQSTSRLSPLFPEKKKKECIKLDTQEQLHLCILPGHPAVWSSYSQVGTIWLIDVQPACSHDPKVRHELTVVST